MKHSFTYAAKFLGFAFVFVTVALFIGFNADRFLNDFPRRPSVDADGAAKPVIIIDAGHGGEDGGASTADGVPEKDINLAVSKNLCDLLKLAGYDARLTRSDDRLLYDMYSDLADYTGMKKTYDLRNRLKFTEASGGTVFISLHCNKFPDEKYSGMQVFYSTSDAGSQRLAELLKSHNKSYLQPDNDREIKHASSSIYLLRYSKIPAVLVECGFLSNPEEAAKLSSDEYRKQLATVLFSAVCEYLNNSSDS